MFCAISGKPLKKPVFSPKSKCVFEKSLIESYVLQNGQDPINKEPLSVDELVEIAQTPEQYAMSNSVNSPTLKANYSIPNLLSSLQDEWDAVMLENFQLRQQLDASKVELSTALYKFDAAMNVATRATLETEKLKQELSILSQNLAPAQTEESDVMEQEISTVVSSETIQKMIQKSQDFAKDSRKNKFRPLPCSKVSTEVEVLAEVTPNTEMTSAYVDGNIARGKLVLFYNLEGSCKIVSALKYETGTIYTVLPESDSISFAEPLNETQVLFGTKMGAHGIYDLSQQQTINSLRFNEGREIIMASWVKEVSDHAYVVVDSSGAIALADVEQNCDLDFRANEFPTYYAHLHKDGLLLLQGNDEKLIVQTLSDLQKPAIEFDHDIESEGPIRSARFASNGYWLVLATQKMIKVFDLRKKPNTLALEALVFENEDLVSWDLDPSMKSLFVVVESGGLSRVEFYSFDKSAKRWVQKPEFTYSSKNVQDLTYVWDSQSGFIKALAENEIISLKLD
ncbi:LAME_0H16886g1_1 [Lachancea meyersii CBS 8951]|uniref:Pre-mRNA-processing factor 19 n=1 Tax=Lachancea meyersii CBS 8951 TaxID=1266667 RepID=A0A1G4KI56_9SACH|nr:LAME_0H16886g1_1 [Lachancea meyersii CBS 8951]